MSLRVLAGDNAYKLFTEIAQAKQDFTAKFPHGEIIVIDAESREFEAFKSALEARSLFSEDRLIIAQGFMLGHEVEELEALLMSARDDSGISLVVVERTLDKRTRLYGWLKKLPEFEEFVKLKKPDLLAWAKTYASEIGLEISRDQIETVVDYSAEDQLSLKNNLDKLALVEGPISSGIISELVQDQSKTGSFSILEAVFQGNSRLVEQVYSALMSQGEEPHAILGLVAWQINMIVSAKFVPKNERSAFAAEFKISDYAFSKAASLADRISREDLHELLEATAKLDIDSKTKSIDMERALLAMLLRIAAKF